jgi:hypothetical protein
MGQKGAEKVGEMAQVVQHLPSKREALSSNPSAAKKKKERKKGKEKRKEQKTQEGRIDTDAGKGHFNLVTGVAP